MCCSVLSPEIVKHDAYIGGRSENNIKCVIAHNNLEHKNRTTRYNCRFFCRVIDITSNFLSFIVVESIRFFHGALQLHSLQSVPPQKSLYLFLVVHYPGGPGLISFVVAKDDGGGGDNWSYKITSSLITRLVVLVLYQQLHLKNCYMYL